MASDNNQKKKNQYLGIRKKTPRQATTITQIHRKDTVPLAKDCTMIKETITNQQVVTTIPTKAVLCQPLPPLRLPRQHISTAREDLISISKARFLNSQTMVNQVDILPKKEITAPQTTGAMKAFPHLILQFRVTKIHLTEMQPTHKWNLSRARLAHCTQPKNLNKGL